MMNVRLIGTDSHSHTHNRSSFICVYAVRHTYRHLHRVIFFGYTPIYENERQDGAAAAAAG